MKTIKILGIVVIGFATITDAFAKQNFQPENEQLIEIVAKNNLFEDSLALNVETSYFNPEDVLPAYHPSLEEVIKMDDEIIAAKEIIYQPLTMGKTIEDIIEEDNRIIESALPEFYLLDFEKINNELNLFSQFQNKMSLKTEDIKW